MKLKAFYNKFVLKETITAGDIGSAVFNPSEIKSGDAQNTNLFSKERQKYNWDKYFKLNKKKKFSKKDKIKIFNPDSFTLIKRR